MTDDTPKATICKTKKKISGTGTVIEEDYLFVAGENLEEVKKIFDERWKE